MDFNNISVPLDSPLSLPHFKEAMQNKEEKNLQSFWENQMLNLELDKEFKSQVAKTRIRRTMKVDADMVSAESQLLMAKACEVLIQELTYRAWFNTKERNRITMKPIDIAKVIMETNPFDDFFMGVVTQYCASDVKLQPPNFTRSSLLLSILITGNQILPSPSPLLLRRRRFFSFAIVVVVSPLTQLPLLLALPSTFKRSFTSSGITCPSSATFVPESDSSSTFFAQFSREASTCHILTPFGMREYKVHLDIPRLRLRWRR
ncbi:unnamed protein product [Trifolium pratense]|uniref:Uncharacterized protein n=1 Tax=Trifolium pratense TaxID=57577 RepID=A0ACB0K529_TRIPR|nr:unnamed protein product [Trifolium pratense]